MQGWQTSYLGLRDLPRELSEFELQAFFSFGRNELELIARRRGDNHKLGLALHIGFVRMSGRPLNSVRAGFCRNSGVKFKSRVIGRGSKGQRIELGGCGRSFGFGAVELSLLDHVHRLDARRNDPRAVE